MDERRTGDPKRCKAQVGEALGIGITWHQCFRKSWKGGYCKQHHPETVKAQNIAREAKQKARDATWDRRADRREKEAAVIQAARDWFRNRSRYSLTLSLYRAVAALEELDTPEAKK